MMRPAIDVLTKFFQTNRTLLNVRRFVAQFVLFRLWIISQSAPTIWFAPLEKKAQVNTGYRRNVNQKRVICDVPVALEILPSIHMNAELVREPNRLLVQARGWLVSHCSLVRNSFAISNCKCKGTRSTHTQKESSLEQKVMSEKPSVMKEYILKVMSEQSVMKEYIHK